MSDKIAGLPVFTDLATPDIFADEALAFHHLNGTIRITFAVLKPREPAPPSPMQYVSVARIVLPPGAAQRLAVPLFDYLKRHGLDPAALIQGDKTKQ